jgi:hypothetical protein
MGFFDKVKGAVNKLTGGGAKVTLSVNGNELNGTLNVAVNAEIKDNPIEIKKVYLWVKSQEKIDIPKNSLPSNLREHATFGLNLTNDKFPKKEFVVAEAQKLEGKQTYNWSIDIRLDGNTVPSYNGQFASHEWLFLAGLDCSGNDPDSGWQKFDLK